MASWSAETLSCGHFFQRPELKAIFTGILADFVVLPSWFPGLGIARMQSRDVFRPQDSPAAEPSRSADRLYCSPSAESGSWSRRWRAAISGAGAGSDRKDDEKRILTDGVDHVGGASASPGRACRLTRATGRRLRGAKEPARARWAQEHLTGNPSAESRPCNRWNRARGRTWVGFDVRSTQLGGAQRSSYWSTLPGTRAAMRAWPSSSGSRMAAALRRRLLLPRRDASRAAPSLGPGALPARRRRRRQKATKPGGAANAGAEPRRRGTGLLLPRPTRVRSGARSRSGLGSVPQQELPHPLHGIRDHFRLLPPFDELGVRRQRDDLTRGLRRVVEVVAQQDEHGDPASADEIA